MAVWVTRPDLGDPATLAHANVDPGGYGRPSGPACGASGSGLRYAAEVAWDDVATTARCDACTRALPPPPGRP